MLLEDSLQTYVASGGRTFNDDADTQKVILKMTEHVLAESTLDDLMRAVVQEILGNGSRISPSKGPALEVSGVMLELGDPKSRLSRSETRGRAFSALGELCWYLAGSNRTQFITHYISAYSEFDRQGTIYGAYGPRLFDFNGIDQVANVIERLNDHADSRRAVIQIFDAGDLPSGESEIPCTCTIQFLLRDGALQMLVTMRSNDVVIGLPHDIFCFTMIQELVATTLGANLGWYRHVVGSLHIYDEDRDMAETFLGEGWQATNSPMPAMPRGDPWPAVRQFLEFEARIRAGEVIEEPHLCAIDPYWADLVRLLLVHSAAKNDDIHMINNLRDQMASDSYHTFIDGRVDRLLSGE